MNKPIVNSLIPIGLPLYATTAWAASETFALQMRGYDFESLAWSLAAGLLGGAIRTIVTLAGKKRWVLDVFKEAAKDLIVAMMAGLLAYVVALGASSLMQTYFGMSPIPRDIVVWILIAAGWAPKVFFRGVDKSTASAIDRFDDAIKNYRRKLPDERDSQPASIVAPLEKP